MNLENNIRKIVPNTLRYLTQKEEVSVEERFYVDEIYLGKFDSEENYREASEEEKIEWENMLSSLEISEECNT